MVDTFYLYTFESTHGAISTEKILKPVGCTVMPVPRNISTSCGIAVRVEPSKYEESKKVFLRETELSPEEYHVYRIEEDKSTKHFEYKPVAL
jgi:hypothetical protein